MKKLKQFLDGCMTIADGVDRAADALSRGRRGPPAGFPNARIIDVVQESEVASYEQGMPVHGQNHRTDIPQHIPQMHGSQPRRREAVATYRDVKTIDERLVYIIDLVQKGRHSAQMREFAVKAISRRCGSRWCTPEGDHWAETKALFDACKEVYRYCGDAFGIDQFQHPERTLEFGGGDCDDCSILICSALGAVGFQTKLRVIRTKTSSDWNHIFALVGLPQKSPSKWVPLDLSVNEPAGWQPPREMVAAHKDFDIPLIR